MLKNTLAIAIAVTTFLPVGAWLYSARPMSSAERESIAQWFVNPVECRPEPGERMAFLAGMLCIPFTVLLLGYGFQRARTVAIVLQQFGRIWPVGLVFGAFFILFGCRCLVPEGFFHVRQSIYWIHPLVTLPLMIGSLAAVWFARTNQTIRWTVNVLAFGMVALIAAACVFDEGGEYCRDWHFTAVFNSVVQVHFGKALLIDARGQYGLYPHFLEPLFAVTGLGVVQFTVVMAVLLASAYLTIWVVMRGLIRNKLIALFGFLALVFTSWLYLRFSKDGRFQWVDHYFQYHPIRFLFPALLVGCAWKYFRRPTSGWYWLTSILLAAGVLWNLDSGLPTLLTWFAALSYSELFRCGGVPAFRRIGRHLFACIVCVAGTVSLVVAAIYVQYGAAPDFSELLRFQQLFYVSGFFMLPMEWPGAWVLVVLVYLSGLAFSAGQLAKLRRIEINRIATAALLAKMAFRLVRPELKTAMSESAVHAHSFQHRSIGELPARSASDGSVPYPSLALRAGEVLGHEGKPSPPHGNAAQLRATLVFLLSVLGLGLFSYYQGRSHEYVLTLVLWPCFILLAIFLDELLIVLRRSRTFLHVSSFLLVGWVLTGFAWCAVADVPCIVTLISEQYPRSDRPAAMSMRREAEHLSRHVAAGEPMLILAPWEPVLHVLSRTTPIAPCSYIEMVLVDDYLELLSRLESQPAAKVYIDKDVFAWNWKRVGSRQLIDAIQQSYLFAAETPAGYIFARGDLALRSAEQPLCHFGFQDGRFPAAFQAAPVSIENDFSIELVVNPDSVQRPWRVMLSNHCGSPAHQGFMIFETAPNLYELVCGTGTEWRKVVQFGIAPGRWSYLTICRQLGCVRVYVDGELVQLAENQDWTLQNGTSPLIIGDWLNLDCPFHGRIREVRILNRALGETEIAENLRRFNALHY